MPVLLGEFAASGIGRPAAGWDMDMLSQPQRVIAAFLTSTGEIVRPNGVVGVKIKISEFHTAFLVCAIVCTPTRLARSGPRESSAVPDLRISGMIPPSGDWENAEQKEK
jgi:hypothetical protein